MRILALASRHANGLTFSAPLPCFQIKKKQDRPSPERGPVLQKQIANEWRIVSTLTLDSDSMLANHPKVVARMTLGTCTAEWCGRDYAVGWKSKLELWPYAAGGSAVLAREDLPSTILSVRRKSSPRLQADFVVGRRNSITLPLCSGETHFTRFKNLVGM